MAGLQRALDIQTRREWKSKEENAVKQWEMECEMDELRRQLDELNSEQD